MRLEISVTPETVAWLEEKAKLAGVDIETYAGRHLNVVAAGRRLFDSVHRPTTDPTADEELAEQELAQWIDEEIDAMHAEQRAAGLEPR